MFWRVLFPIVFLYAMVEGAVYNLSYPAKLPYLYKDILLGIIYLFYFMNEQFFQEMKRLKERIGDAAWFSAAGFLVVGVCQIFNPFAHELIVGLLGFRILFFYWPLMLIAFTYFDRKEKIVTLMKWIVFCSIPVNIFGLVQYFMGPEFLVMVYGPNLAVAMDIAFIDGYRPDESFLRIIGTFGASGQYGRFLVFCITACFALIFSKPKKQILFLLIGSQLLSFTALLACGHRTSFGLLMITLFVFLVWRRHVRTLLIAIVIGGAAMAVGLHVLGDPVSARIGTIKDVKYVGHRTLETPAQQFAKFLEERPLGRGLGSASTASRHIVGSNIKSWELVENYPTKLIAEVGLPGFIIYYFFIFFLLKRWFSVWLRTLDPESANMALAFSAFCFVQFLIGGFFSVIDGAPNVLYLWTVVGMVARMSLWTHERSTGLSRI